MSRRTEPTPFWATKPAKPPRLAGTHDSLVAAARAAGGVLRGYSKTGSYALGDLVCHPRYQVGVVVELPERGKVLLRFADRDRLLVAGQPR